jgi:hypothetical protein
MPSTARAAGAEAHRALLLAAQLTRGDGRLLRAKELFMDCHAQACTDEDSTTALQECESIRALCEKRSKELDVEIPTVKVEVVDDRNNLLDKAHARLGLRAMSPGEVVSLDPGHYTIVADQSGRSSTTEVTLGRGDHASARIVIDLRATIFERPTPRFVYASGAVTGVAVLTMAVMGVWNTVQRSKLDTCKPTCETTLRGPFVASGVGFDIALGVSLVAAGTTVIGYLTRPSLPRVIHLDEADSALRSAP